MKFLTADRFMPAALLVLSLSGCGGGSGGGSFVIGDSDDDSGTTTATYSISGTVSATTGITVDSDVNDDYATYASNDEPAKAQALSNIATVQGFASAEATGAALSGEASLERFADIYDKYDYYSATLSAGQTIQLQVVNYQSAEDEYQGDLDLYLLNPNDTSSAVASSANDGSAYESLTVPADGTYLIVVYAYSGISKYVLQLLAENSSAALPAAAPADDFVANQVIMSSTSISASAAAAGVSIASSKTVQGGPTLMTLSRTQAAVKAGTSKDNALRAYNERLWEKVQTLMDIKRLRAQHGVEFAEPNYIRKPLATTPTDPKYVQQWHYRNIDLPAAWDLSKGDDVIVAVVDTGVFLAHEDLAANLIAGYDFISDTSISLDGNGIDNNPDDPGDKSNSGQSSWHGTHVAGTVAAVKGNSLGGVGVAWNAKVMPIRVLGYGGGTSYDIIQGVRYAAGLSNDSSTLPKQKAGVINLSLGGSSYSAAEQAAYSAAINNGVIIVAAAGNSATSTPFYPAAYDGVISVSATDYNDELSYYSNYGSTIDIAAPGGDTGVDSNGDFRADGILSTYVALDGSGNRQSTYSYAMQGTSMASPHVAGVIALMKSIYPQLTANNVNALIQSCAITSKATDASCVRDNRYGYGLINAYLAVTKAIELANGDTDVSLPVSLQTSPTSLVFGSLTSSLSFVLSNGGDDAAHVTGVSDDADWLTITRPAASDGLGTYTATVSRVGLADGSYSASITLTDASGSTATVNVYMQVGSVGTADDMTVQYVVLTEAGCASPDNCYSRSAKASVSGYYSISGVPEGSYYVVAGSDIDVDLLICDDGETCGAYPTTGAIQAVNLNANRSGVNFLVSLISGSDSSTASVARSSDDGTSDSTSKAIAR